METSTQTTVMITESVKPVQADINYWGTDRDPDESETIEILSGRSPWTRPVTSDIHDIRPEWAQYNIDKHAFQVLKHSSNLLPPIRDASDPADFHDLDMVRSIYWPEISRLLRSSFGVRATATINTTVRDVIERRDVDPRNPRANPRASLNPFFAAHGDYTAAGSRAHVRAMLPSFFEDTKCIENTTAAEREEFLTLRQEIIAAEDKAVAQSGASDLSTWNGSCYTGPRWAMLSVWRPLEVVKRDPLAIMDPNTFFEKTPGCNRPYVDMVRMYRDRPGFQPAYQSINMFPIVPEASRDHRWYWLSNQRPDEVFAIKLFDSEGWKSGSDVAPCAVHSAFSLPGTQDEMPRRSVEIRVMIIW